MAIAESRLQEDWLAETNPSFEVDPKRCALLVIDMQYASACRTAGVGKYVAQRDEQDPLLYRFDRIESLVIPNIGGLLRYFRDHELNVVYITLGSRRADYSDVLPRIRMRARLLQNRRGTKNHEILAEVRPEVGELVLNKTSIGAFTTTPLDAILRYMGVEYLIFTGVSTSHCVETSLRQAADLGYQCVLVEDCCAEDDSEQHEMTIRHIRRVYGRVATTQSMMAELERSRTAV